MKSFIPYAHQSFSSEDIQAVADSLKEGCITRGPLVEAFEKGVADYCSAAYAVAFNSGASALMASYYAGDANVNDQVITSPNNFIATAGAALHCKTAPLFLDIDRSTGNFNLEQLKINLEEFHSTRGKVFIAPAHFSGIPVDMQKLDGIIVQPNAVIIEDATIAFGSRYTDGQKVGSCSWSHMTVFSFHPTHMITTGEGGMVTTNDEELYRRLRLYRDNGINRNPDPGTEGWYPGYYEVEELSGNYNFTDFQAALGIAQLKRLDEIVSKRQALVKRYRDKLKDVPHVRLFTEEFDKRTAFHLFVVQIDFAAYKKTRKEIMEKLRERGIGTQVHYIPLYRHPLFSRGKEPLNAYFPEMEAYFSQALTLPLHNGLEKAQVDEICKVLVEILGG